MHMHLIFGNLKPANLIEIAIFYLRHVLIYQVML